MYSRVVQTGSASLLYCRVCHIIVLLYTIHILRLFIWAYYVHFSLCALLSLVKHGIIHMKERHLSTPQDMVQRPPVASADRLRRDASSAAFALWRARASIVFRATCFRGTCGVLLHTQTGVAVIQWPRRTCAEAQVRQGASTAAAVAGGANASGTSWYNCSWSGGF